ncbi:MAG: SDR family NAD(P)-dependent oxidoreductase [Rhodoferax sp.]|uniref:SDR family NAD(P)-dependent oxidoreductase n=1 Tax=Rhodoferax sp. TaxID=50421 RepID=UPI0017E28CAB|nr:SDR family NAD(P)-dependent oxidoreductase [Rhodoferax sp.]NMM15142.1 SDR family NAD(P)-dependent oxidoreductase [Rhodoferax sp.]
MTQHLYLLTGASRGMGLAMAEQLLSADHFLVCISRHTNEILASRAAKLGCQLEQWPLDLERSLDAAAKLKQWLASQKTGSFVSATLINNAGVMPGVAPLSESDPIDLSWALRVGLEAPLLLTAAFLGATASWNIPRKVLNISSGLGRRAMASQAGYCAAKAGMDHFTRCLALDEARKPLGAKVCSLAPGVIDTAMQVQLRAAEASAFPDKQNFVDLKVNDQLTSPDMAATQVLAYLARPDFGQQPIADVRD